MVNKFELFNLFKMFTVPNWQILPYTAPVFTNWGGIPYKYSTTTTTYGSNVGYSQQVGGIYSSGVTSMGQTYVAPPVIEKAYVQDVPAQSRMEYIPYQKTNIVYDQVERVEQVPVQRVVTDYVPVTRQEMVPVEKTVQDYYAVETQVQYVPRVVEEKVVDYIQQERIQ